MSKVKETLEDAVYQPRAGETRIGRVIFGPAGPIGPDRHTDTTDFGRGVRRTVLESPPTIPSGGGVIEYDTKFDSSKFETYDTGASRESKGGKGRFDLISPHAMRRLAVVYEKGAAAHGDRNWEHGMKFSGLASSALRHVCQWLLGLKDEDHLAQAIWNLAAIIHFEEEKRVDLDDRKGVLKNE